MQAPITAKAETKCDSEAGLPSASSVPTVRLDPIEGARGSMPIFGSPKHHALPDAGREATPDMPELEEGDEDPATEKPRFCVEAQSRWTEDDGTLRKPQGKNSRATETKPTKRCALGSSGQEEEAEASKEQ